MVIATVACIVEREGKIALILRKWPPFPDTWVLPGGRIDEGETAHSTAIREIKEETGLDIDPHFFAYNDESFPNHKWFATVIVFYAGAKGTVKKDKSETKDIRWFSPADINELPMGFNHKSIIHDFYNE